MPRDFVLYLGSVLVNPDYPGIERYLAHPSREPEYRAGRTHRDFIAGLAELSGRALKPAELVAGLETEAGKLAGILDGKTT
jgi:lipoate-protein ligase A